MYSVFAKAFSVGLVIFGLVVHVPVQAQQKQSLEGDVYRIIRVSSTDLAGHFLIITDQANASGCSMGDWDGWRNGMIIPRSLPNFNELVSLATAAMLAGKQIKVWSGVPFRDSPCVDGAGSVVANNYGLARISRLDVIN
jgi:hypothetical protein